jgi:CRP/FNR family transcriptional regulator, cyclic AMP receptor protein
MGTDELVAVLEKVDLFHDLRLRVLRRIAEAGREERFEPGDVVIAEGEEVSGFRSFSQRGVEMHVVLTGSAIASVRGQQHAELRPGEYFGELSLIDGLPRSAEVRAGGRGLSTFAVSKWTFADLLDEHPEVALPMLRVMVARLRATEAAADRPT